MKRKMNKHLARLCLCLMLVYLLVPALSMRAYAEEAKSPILRWNKEYETATVSTSSSSYTEGDPCWVLQDVRTSSKATEYREVGGELTYKEYGYVQVHFDRYKTGTVDITSRASQMPNILCPGDTLTINYDFDIQADLSNEANETFSISGQITRYSMLEDFEPQEFWDKKEALEMIEYWYFVSDSKTKTYDINVGIGNASDGETALFHEGTDIIKDGSYLNTTYPVGQPGELLEVCVYYHYGSFSLVQEKYLYAWEGSTTQNVIVEAGNGPGETGEEIESGIIKPGSNQGSSGDDSGWTGGDDGGDDDGNALGTLAKVGGGAAAAGIGIKVIKGLAGKSGKSGGDGGKKKKKKKREEESGDDPRDEQKEEKKDEDEKKRYEMRVYKEFGDTIYAGKTVTLSARIVEISASGVERTAPELTQQITISSSNYLQVGGTFLSGQYQSARVTAPEYDEAVPSTAVVTFRLMAPGGSFTQHMRFNIKKADPEVVWPDLQRGLDPYLEIIAGDNATYPVRFFFHDVSEEPEKIEFDRYNDYEITVEPADTMYTYWAMVKNRTAPLENKIYQHGSRYPSGRVKFTATFKDGLKLEGYFAIVHYPDGLSVITDLEDGRIPVEAYKKEYYGDLDSPYPMSGLRYSCAHRTENGVEVFQPYEEDLRYGSLQGDRGETDNNVAMKYPYRADVWGFMPLKTLNEPSPGATYLMKIDVVWKEKPDDVLTLPLTFHLKPKDPMEEWNKEYKKLQQLVVNFSVPETIEVNLAKIKRITPQNTSQYELRLFNKAILKDYIAYWESEAKYEIDLANYLEDLENGASWLDFLGDCAFTYIIYYYSTLHGYASAAPYLDAVLSPAKDLFEEFAGRCTWAYIDSNSIDWDGFLKMVTDRGKSALDDVLFEMIPDDAKDFFKVKPVNLKKVGLMISCYIMVDFSMNLAKNRIDMDDSEERKKQLQMTDEEFEEATSWTNSIYTALLDTFKDMSLKFITSIVGKNIEKYLEKPNVREKLGKWVSGTLNIWWKGEKATREGLKGAKQAYFALERRKKDNTLKKLSKELSQQHQRLDISSSNKIDKALEELEKFTSTLKKIVNTKEELEKLQSKSIKILNDDIDKIAKRSEIFSDWKKKVQETLLKLPEKEVANLLFSKNWFFTRKGGGWWGYSFGMLFDKLVSDGAGKVYDLTTGAMIDQINGLEEDRNAQTEAEQAAAEMEAQVETKKLLAQLLLDVEKAETPEEIVRLVDRFQKELEPPQEEQDDDDYAFDSDPEFKTGEDGCTYVVLKFRKSGTNEGYRFEYNLSKMLRNLVDSKLGIEFVKSLFGGSVPELPEGKLPMPSDPPLASDLR